MKVRIQWAARAALLSCTLLPACSHASATEPRKPVPVKVTSAELSADLSLARYSGSLEPLTRVDMAFRVGGYVEALGETTENGKRRALDKGDFVKKGTVLARVRAQDYAQKLATASAMTGEARAEARLAEVELERAQRLLDTKAITRAEFDAKLARAEYARAAVEGALAHQAEASLALGDTVLRAPMDGVLLVRHVEVGTLVSPGQPAMSVADTRTLKAVFGVPQTLVASLQVGAPLKVYVGGADTAEPERKIDAQVTRIAPAADAQGRVFSVEAALPNHDGALRAGSVVSIHVASDVTERSPAVLIPLSSVVRAPLHEGGFALFVLDGQGDRAIARMRSVQLGEVLGNSVTVTRGLSPGQRVVTLGSTLLRDGSDAIVIR